MGVYVEKSPLADAEMHEDVPVKHVHATANAMTLVVAKPPQMAPRTATHAWNGNVDPKLSNARQVEHVPVVTFQRTACRTPVSVEVNMKPRHCRSMPFSRKRRLVDVAERPTKHLRLSKHDVARVDDQAYDCPVVEPMHEGKAHKKFSRPRTLHFALPGLSSRETLQILGELVSVRHELAWLNTTRPVDAAIIPVFGWRSAVWSIPTPKGNDAIVFKSAKAFEAVAMHSIARQLWTWQGSQGFTELSAPHKVYTISNEIRIVRQMDRLHGRAPHTSLWLEYIHDHGESIFMVRKELHRFQDSITGPPSRSERECHGYILHPLLIPMGSQVVAGTALHSIGSIRSRGLSTQHQIRRIIADMPRHVLQWEDSFVLDPSRL